MAFNWTLPRTGKIEFVRVSDGTKEEIGILGQVVSGSLDLNLNTALKVSGEFVIDEMDDLGDDLVRIYLDATDSNGEHIRLALATLYVATPERNIKGARVTKEFEAYSTLIRLRDECVKQSYTIPKGTNAIKMALELCRSCRLEVNHAESSFTTTTQTVYEAGTSKLKIVNELLAFAGYQSANVNGYGNVTFVKQSDVTKSQPVYTFSDDETSILYSNIKDSRDWYSTPNVVICTSTSQDKTMAATAVNNNPKDPYSTVSRKREIARVEEISDIPDYKALQAKADLLLQTSSLRMQHVEFASGFVPINVGDVIALDIQSANLDGKYSVQSMSIDLTQALKTQTKVRRFF